VKRIGILGSAGIVAGVAALGYVGARSPADARVAERPPEAIVTASVLPGPAAVLESAALSPANSPEVEAPAAMIIERAQQAVPPVPQPRSRRRSRKRYPGPIPTPADWQQPEGPVRIALQAGHWRANEAPSELAGLRDNGTSWRGTAEWETNLAIARSAGEMLQQLGYAVDILPAVVPPDYRAHLFIAIHADGSGDTNARGYRVAAPSRDATGRAEQMVGLLDKSYGDATGLRRLVDTTRRMRNYYAFNFRRYEHALHPMTIGVIIETGFLTSATDRLVIVDAPERAARGIVDAVLAFPVTALPGTSSTPPPGD
jgi:N-acetylmuramoyl-L-alanine amidase